MDRFEAREAIVEWFRGEDLLEDVRDYAHEAALADGFEVKPIALACREATGVMLLIPDEVMPEVYAEHVAPNLSAGDLVSFASGYNVAFGMIEPAAELDVVLVAPRMIGVGVRDGFLSGKGYPAFVGVHQDATGRAKERMLAISKGVGATRGGCIEMTMHDEASLDLFTEQAFGPAFGRVLMAAIDTMVEAGYPPEAVLMELYLSGEFAYSLQKTRELGALRQHQLHSHTSQYGTITRSARYLDLDPLLKEKMRQSLEEIRSGAFAREWSADRGGKLELIERVRQIQASMPMTRWEADARRAFRIGDAKREP